MTFFETAGQSFAFLLLLYAGMAAGVLYDVFAVLRHRLPMFAGGVLDVVWCLLATALCGLGLALGGEGRVRLFALLGLCCGGGIYCLGVRRAINALARGVKSRKNLPGRRNPPERDEGGSEPCGEK